jgi:UDP-N-acetylglucosamine--N-acetylmuramyl-(pentapeptide) pyrophosphoryl-undecaprenol N-acetylglucosamine transferase
MRLMSEKGSDIIHIHSTGDIGAAEFRESFKKYGLDKNSNIKVHEYIHNMPDIMAAADVVVCRAGAMTVSEISMMKKAAIFIPSPNVVDNHQYKNAKLLADNNAAAVIEETDLTPQKLVSEIERFINNPETRRNIEENVFAFSNLSANRLIYDEIIRLVNEHYDRA